MYVCIECGLKFENPLQLEEKHNLNSPPFESISVCPRCKTTNFKSEAVRYCRCCGVRLSSTKADYCSDRCETNGKKLWQKEFAHKNILYESEIYKLVRMVDEYNLKNRTRLSYGQFVALITLKKKRGKRNEK